MEELNLPSGALLKINPAPFADSKELMQAVMIEMKVSSASAHTGAEIQTVLTQFFCAGFSSKEVDRCLWKCAARCLYNGEKVTPTTFEDVDKRQDYMPVMLAVAKANLTPFLKSLFAEFQTALAIVSSIQGPK